MWNWCNDFIEDLDGNYENFQRSYWHVQSMVIVRDIFYGHVQSMVIVRDIFMDTFNPGYIERLGKMHL